MKMMLQHIKSFIGRVVVLCLLPMLVTSCVNEKIESNDFSEEPNGKYYITLTLTVPNTTRSSTNTDGSSSDGMLSGTSLESSLQNAQLFFCVGNKIVASFTAYYPTLTDLGDENKYDKTYTVTAYIDDISKLEELAGKKVDLFVVGNFDTVSNHSFTNAQGDASFTISDSESSPIESSPIGDFGTDGRGKVMPLVNAEEFEINAFKEKTDLEGIKGLFTKDENSSFSIFNIGSFDLERAVARIDWADGSGKNWIYPIGGENSDIKVQLYELQPFNVNSKSYLFRHTALGNNIEAYVNSISIFGDEKGTGTGYNWIASSDWGLDEKSLLNPTKTDDSNIDETIKVITGIKSNEGKILISNLEKRNPSSTYNDINYYPWRYVTENTVNSNNIDFTQNATGIAIKFRVLDASGDNPLTPQTEDNLIPSGIEKVTPEEGEDEDKNTIKITNPADQTWITVDYDGSDSGYFITYYVYVVHNHDKYKSHSGDNADALCPMEYAVVRNNVYQLKVNSISGLPNPNEPDNKYLNMEIRVLSWAKREIHIEGW